MYEETNPPDIEESVVLAAAKSCFPQIAKPRIRFHYHGTYNVYLIEGEYMFKFPSTILSLDERQKLVRREALLLERLRSHLTFEIPAPEFVDTNSDSPYMGYRMIPGTSLSRHFDSTTSEQQRFLGNQVGRFLSQLHAIDGSALGIGNDGTYKSEESLREFREVFARVQDIIFPNLSKQEIEWTEDLFHDFLDSIENFQFKPVLVHGDFDTSNILVNHESYTITGMIDFEESRVYDPAADLIFLSEGVEFLTSLLHTYTGKKDPRLGQRVVFRLGRQPFIYILWGTEHDLEAMVTYGYAALRDFIKNWEGYASVAKQCFNT
ncbi:MAG: phosphotransferase family protein [Candidatus Thorarchaeota archaeon]|jgi:aminoglycoside 2''-phosphotransferase